jgi:hypothetical protein
MLTNIQTIAFAQNSDYSDSETYEGLIPKCLESLPVNVRIIIFIASIIIVYFVGFLGAGYLRVKQGEKEAKIKKQQPPP